MHLLFKNIKAVGFDLDKTLYRETLEMKKRAGEKVFETILKLRPELKTIENVTREFGGKYKEYGSWSVLLREELGIENPAPLLMQCFETADILNYIPADDGLSKLMHKLSEKYFLFLITGSSKNTATAKLGKIGIDPHVFNFSLFADDPKFVSKLKPDSFMYYLSQSPYLPQEHVYIGDSPQSDILVPQSLGMKTIFVGEEPFARADHSVHEIGAISQALL